VEQDVHDAFLKLVRQGSNQANLFCQKIGKLFDPVRIFLHSEWNFHPSVEIRCPPGLRNPSSLCFLNATIQAIFGISYCAHWMITEAISQTPGIPELRALVQLMVNGTQTVCNPAAFVRAWQGFGDRPIDPTIQQDAAEFLHYLLNSLPDHFQSLFRAQYVTDAAIPGNPPTTESSLLLPTSIVSHLTLNTSLRDIRLENAPPILLIQLGRFQWDGFSRRIRKIRTPLSFTPELKIGSVHSYLLHGVIVHSGTAPSGQYRSFVRDYASTHELDFFLFNDSDVSSVGWDIVMRESFSCPDADERISCATVLIYVDPEYTHQGKNLRIEPGVADQLENSIKHSAVKPVTQWPACCCTRQSFTRFLICSLCNT
jgi:hypothetical protein